jgi:hypothetical protein
MRRLIAVALMAVTSSGIGLAVTATSAHATALDCAQLTNPTANQLVQSVCNTVDPHGG